MRFWVSRNQESGEILQELLRLQAEQTDLLSRLARLEIGRGDLPRRQIPAAVEVAPRPATPETLNDEQEEEEVAGRIVIGTFVRVRTKLSIRLYPTQRKVCRTNTSRNTGDR